MSTLTITRGLPAAGKTTWAKAWVAEAPTARARVNRDDLRAMMYAAPMLPWELEEAVTKAQRAAVKALLDAGFDVVADDTNLRPKYVREWARFAHGCGAEFDVFELPLSVEESLERDAARGNKVGAEAIRRMAEKFTRNGVLLPVPDDVFDLPQDLGPLYVTPADGIPAVIVDLDGTLCLHNGRSPYDLTRCGDDLPNLPVVEAVRAARASGLAIIFCSGREDRAYPDTLEWLEQHVDYQEHEPLLMRKDGDRRKDAIVKRELFDLWIRDRYDVRYVLDDRNQVVDMWRALGLTVFQVADGNF